MLLLLLLGLCGLRECSNSIAASSNGRTAGVTSAAYRLVISNIDDHFSTTISCRPSNLTSLLSKALFALVYCT
ncbi:unnamed protein product [Brugia pahangi]|uniref:Secreted protein n=1 Tax=Brugia pahangi TaxID=6280 RepID=A0A0N4SY52_BRUPA|nr:unnamed protein product [Brugia pahangi]